MRRYFRGEGGARRREMCLESRGLSGERREGGKGGSERRDGGEEGVVFIIEAAGRGG